jgi:hypothetical protein
MAAVVAVAVETAIGLTPLFPAHPLRHRVAHDYNVIGKG